MGKLALKQSAFKFISKGTLSGGVGHHIASFQADDRFVTNAGRELSSPAKNTAQFRNCTPIFSFERRFPPALATDP